MYIYIFLDSSLPNTSNALILSMEAKKKLHVCLELNIKVLSPITSIKERKRVTALPRTKLF